MRRKLFQIAAAGSVLVCLAAVVLWVRSYWISDWVAVIHRHAPMRTSSAGAVTWSGSFGVYIYLGTQSDYSDPRDTLLQYYPQPADAVIIFPFNPSTRLWLGFGGGLSPRGNIQCIAPGWIVVLLSGAAAALSLRLSRHRHRADRAGLCPTCGYDLRATPERCPECGADPALVK